MDPLDIISRSLLDFERDVEDGAGLCAVAEDFRKIAMDLGLWRALLKNYLRDIVENVNLSRANVSETELWIAGADGGEKCKLHLRLTLHDKPAPVLFSNPSYVLIAPINGPLLVETYLLPESWRPEFFDATVRLTPGPSLELQTGKCLFIEPGPTVYNILPRSPTLVLKLITDPVETFEWSFDPFSLRPFQSICSQPDDTFLVESCLAAHAVGDAAFIRPLVRLSHHPKHFVRWAAVRALGMIDAGVCDKRLEDMRCDPHPHVAAAAKAATADFSEGRHGVHA